MIAKLYVMWNKEFNYFNISFTKFLDEQILKLYLTITALTRYIY